MRRNLIIITTSAALSSALTLLATAAVCLYLGVLRIGAPDPLQMALDVEGSQLAVIYPVGTAHDVEQMERAVTQQAKGGRQ